MCLVFTQAVNRAQQVCSTSMQHDLRVVLYMIHIQVRNYLDCPVQGGTCKGVGVLRVEYHLHNIVRVALKHLSARPVLQSPAVTI